MHRPRHVYASASAAFAVLLTLCACDGGDPRPLPTPMPPVTSTPPPEPPPPPPAPPPGPELFRTCVVSGWDERPVAARVLVDGKTTQTDSGGCISDKDGLRGRAIDIEATGYLPRKTRIDRDVITLWPAASAAEADAIRTMVFLGQNGEGRLVQLNLQATLVLQMPEPDRYLPDFIAAADEINNVTRGQRFGVSQSYTGSGPWWPVVEDNSIPADCGEERRFGFCLPYIFLREDDGGTVHVRSDVLASPGTPLRIMAYSFLQRPNPLPGLLNSSTSQFTTLTDLERRVLRMLFQRRPCTVFPDTDRDVAC